jgi:hypothetical protein
MDLGRKLTRDEADTALLGLAAAAGAFGVSALLMPGLVAAGFGIRRNPATRWLLRLAGARDLALSGMLLSARTGTPEAKRRAAALVAASQFADLGLTALLVGARLAHPLALVTVAGAAGPTAVAALAVHDNYRVE